MLTLSNTLSIIRMPLAFLFLSQNIYVRFISIIFAMITDSIDGYFARKYKSVSKFGAFLDPAMDKFFVYFALSVFVIEHKIKLYYALAMISRDFILIIFGLYLVLTKKFASYEIKPVRFGKIATAMQFLMLIGLTFSYIFPTYVYGIFVILAIFALIEMIKTASYKSI